MHIEMFEALRAAGVPEDRAEKATKAIAAMIEDTARSVVQEAVRPVLLAIGRLDARIDGLERRLDDRSNGLERRIDGLNKSITHNDRLMPWLVGALIGTPMFIFTLTIIAKTVGLIE